MHRLAARFLGIVAFLELPLDWLPAFAHSGVPFCECSEGRGVVYGYVRVRL